jgi:Tol biopolymer transport system component
MLVRFVQRLWFRLLNTIVLCGVSAILTCCSNSTGHEEGQIRVTNPISSTVWEQGQENVSIEWETGDLAGNVLIRLFQDSTVVDTIAAEAINVGDWDTYDVPIGLVPASDYRVHVWWDSGHQDFSEYFSIAARSIFVTEPTSSTVWELGINTIDVRWLTHNLGGMVKITLYRDNTPALVLAESTENDGNFRFPEYRQYLHITAFPPGVNYRVQVFLSDEHSDFSDSFTIRQHQMASSFTQFDQIAFNSDYPMSTVPGCGFCEDIYVMSSSGQLLRRLTTSYGQDLEPTWSPDGTMISFPSNRYWEDGGPGLFIIYSDGNGECRIADGNIRFPEWSPCGSRIAFLYIDVQNAVHGVAVVNIDGSDLTRLTSDPMPGGNIFGVNCPTWSPNGSKIAFEALRGDDSGIWVMNSDGSGQILVRSGGEMPSWSPDGQIIAYVDERQIWLMRPDGTEPRQLTYMELVGETSCRYPDWNSYGTWIVFNFGGIVPVSDTMFTSYTGIYKVDVTSGETVCLNPFGAWYGCPDWH